MLSGYLCLRGEQEGRPSHSWTGSTRLSYDIMICLYMKAISEYLLVNGVDSA